MLNYKFRLYPTMEQEARLVEVIEINRIVYNYFLANNFKSRNDMNYALTELKEQQPVLNQYHSKMLQMISTKVAAARHALKELKKRGYQSGSGKLCYLKQNECNSFTYNQSSFRIEQGWNGKCLLWLAKLGRIEIRIHRRPFNIKQITIVKQAGKWYAVVACNVVIRHLSSIKHKKPVGIDVGITNFAYDSDGSNVDNPQFLTKKLKPVRRANQILSRRKQGSQNWKKALSWLQRLHHRIANKRKDFLHKVSTGYSERYDIIFLEHLRMDTMVKNPHLSKAILDSGWGTFKQMLKYKANMVVEVEPYNTSVNCSRCGNRVPKTLAVRTHRCDLCRLILDRDHNAALNVLQKGLRILDLPMQHGKVTPAETLSRVIEAGTSPQALAVGS